jgi:hypothetical protein
MTRVLPYPLPYDSPSHYFTAHSHLRHPPPARPPPSTRSPRARTGLWASSQTQHFTKHDHLHATAAHATTRRAHHRYCYSPQTFRPSVEAHVRRRGRAAYGRAGLGRPASPLEVRTGTHMATEWWSVRRRKAWEWPRPKVPRLASASAPLLAPGGGSGGEAL